MDKRHGSHLVALPAEIQGMIAECLPHSSDLSSLSLACKTLKAIANPKLYRRLFLRVPQQWEDLGSLQNLVTSAKENLRYTSEIVIEPQQRLRDGDQYGTQSHDNSSNDESHNVSSDDGFSDYESDDEDSLQVFLPREQDSRSLNEFVRLLVKKIPQNQLNQFIWDHTCVIDKRTLELLFDMHGATLRTLRLNRHTWDRLGQLPAGLLKLRLGSLELRNSELNKYHSGLDTHWQAALVAQNCKTLRHLELGFETDAAEDFHGAPIGDDNRCDLQPSKTFGRTLKEECKNLNTSLSLDSLKLFNYDVRVMLNDKCWPSMELRHITRLVLEDCYCLEDVFPRLSSIGNNSRNAHCLLNLISFTFRQKKLVDNDRRQLEDFLCSLPRGLRDLSVLLDGSEDHDHMLNINSILRVHGKTLRTLVWDERGYRRTEMNECRALLPCKDRSAHLSLIAKACPELRELGLALDWAAIRVSNASQAKLFDCVRKLKRLRTLNIRNMPLATAEITWLPLDLHKSWAVSFLENMMKGCKVRSPPELKTIALGAVTWSDVWLGSNYHCSNYFYSNTHKLESVLDFLQLRVYQIDYQYDLQGVCSPMLNLIAKGSPRDIQRESSSLSILEPYWLG